MRIQVWIYEDVCLKFEREMLIGADTRDLRLYGIFSARQNSQIDDSQSFRHSAMKVTIVEEGHYYLRQESILTTQTRRSTASSPLPNPVPILRCHMSLHVY